MKAEDSETFQRVSELDQEMIELTYGSSVRIKLLKLKSYLVFEVCALWWLYDSP